MSEAVLALFVICLSGGLFVVTIVLPIASFFKGRSNAEAARRLRERVEALEGDVRRLQKDLARSASAPVPTAAAAGSPVLARAAIAAPTSAPPPLVATPATGAEMSVPVPAPAPPQSAPTRPGWVRSEPAGQPVVPATASRNVDEAAPPEAPRVPDTQGIDDTLETRIGGRWLLYIGTAALVLGIGFFVKYAFDNNWINETGRVLVGAALGAAMVAGGDRVARRGYPLWGQIVAGGGFVVLYIAVYAALVFYGLVSRPVAFGLMVAITAAAAWAADAHRSFGLALFAAIGGFAVPFLVGGGEDAQLVLLTYDAVLAAGTIVMAERRRWPLLGLAAYLLTGLTFAAWAGVHYAPSKWLLTEIFLTLFAVMFTAAAFLARRREGDDASIASFFLFTAPLVFYGASAANLHSQPLALLVFLTLASLAGVIAGVRLDRPWVRLVTFVIVTPVLAEWLSQHNVEGWRVAAATVYVAIYAMHLVGLGERLHRKPDEWPASEVVLFHLNAIALFGGLYSMVDAVAPSFPAALALGLAAWHGAVAWSARKRSGDAGMNSVAMAFVMLGFAIGRQFDDWWSIVGWAGESAAVVWVGLKSRREWMRFGGALLFAFTVLDLFMLGFFRTPAGMTPVFNARVGATLAVVAVAFGLAALHTRMADQFADKAATERATLWLGGNILLVLLVSTEISFYWTIRHTTDAAADLAMRASLSVAWATYGTILVVVGIMRRYAPIRYLAIGLLALTILKVFLLDLATLGGIYRIIGFIGLGGFLLLGAFLYQRFRAVILGQSEVDK